MKIKAERSACIQFFHEILDEFGEAATFYGMHMNKPGEEMAAEDYERAWVKVQNATKIMFEAKPVKVDG